MKVFCFTWIFVSAVLITLVNTNPLKLNLREKRGAAYAGPHPGGYGQGGVGIPGLNNAMQYAAYSQLLNSGHHQSQGYGSSHGRKLTVDQAIGMFGHHTLGSRSYPYTAGHSATTPGYHGPVARVTPQHTHGHGGGSSSSYGQGGGGGSSNGY